MALSEFEFIKQYCQSLGVQDPAVVLGVGDDAAIINIQEGFSLVVATDTLNVDQHFFADAKPSDLAHKLLHVNLSDIAAMGAVPRWATLSAALPSLDQQWLDDFFSGLQAASKDANVAIVGGDTTKGPMSLTLTIFGLVPNGKALTRGGAVAGDMLCVTGSIGGAALGLYIEQKLRKSDAGSAIDLSSEFCELALTRLHKPMARSDIAPSLIDHANACLDISDGLLGDLQHILISSQVDAVLEWQRLPIDQTLNNFLSLSEKERHRMVLNGGEDYELLFTCSEKQYKEWCAENPELTPHVTHIGSILTRNDGENSAIYLDNENHREIVSATSFTHF